MRIEGWEGRLASYLNTSKDLTFEWGRTDCALWAATWVRSCTGEDFLSDWIGKYKTERGAATLMRKRGFQSVADIADAALPVIPVTLARRGDLVLHPVDGCLGIGNGVKSHFLTFKGHTLVDTLACSKAWGV
ncbi:DUF6950 family protein [Zavarzinella formosa]|uniref:DUF6950 family protein n=1 Tax=Zavarzinella formosa TaxID=360055 RepID=UPI00037E6CF7|nr:hypothetical protein [Zavarzinella formosa]